nr:7TM GPCR chemoreceptor domain containing protein [Haemonchus contortus]
MIFTNLDKQKTLDENFKAIEERFQALVAVLYILCLIGMLRGKLLKIPCYRLMFFNGIIDNMDLLVGSFITAYFDFTGAVFCSSIGLNWFAGYFSWCVWFGASFNCMVLALNRVVEMIPSANGLRFLFEGKLLFLWMVLSLVLMAILPFISRTHPYNSMIGTYIMSPVITDNATQESSRFAQFLVPSYNVFLVFVLLALYASLCFTMIKMRRLVKRGNYKLQIQLFTQALFICTTTAMAALLYCWVGFFPAPPEMAIATHILWQFSHGVHGIMYLCFNRQIRGEALYILCLIGMLRGKLLKIPCYRLMFFNGIIDNMDLLVGSFITAYFDFTGAVFCSSIGLNWFAGYFSWC